MNKKPIALAASLAAALSLAAVPAFADTSDSTDVAVTITADKASYKAGDLVTFTVTVANKGPAEAENVKVTDVLPKGFELVSSSTATPFAWTVDQAASDLGLDSAITVKTLTAADAVTVASDQRNHHLHAVIGDTP